MLESQIERQCARIAKEHNCLLPKWVCPGSNGVPDRILLMPDGEVWFIEFKQPGRKLSPLQDVWRKRLTERGHKHAVISDPDTFAQLCRSAALPAPGD